jgi:hypothetical protein
MTAAGIALIAGGLATMIGFRRALWSGSGRRRAREPRVIAGSARAVAGGAPRAQRAIETSQRRAALSAQAAPVPAARVEPASVRVRPAAMPPAQAGAPDISGAHAAADIRAADIRAADMRAADMRAADMRPVANPESAATREPVAEASAPSGSFAATPDDVVAAVPGARGGRRGRRRGRSRTGRQSAERSAAGRPSTGGWAARQVARGRNDEDERFGLAAIGLAGDDVDGEIVESRTAEPDRVAAGRADATDDEPAAGEPATTARAAEAVSDVVCAAGEESSVDIEAHAGPRLAVEVLHAEQEVAAAQTGDEPSHRRMASRVLARADEGTREGARFDLSAGRLIRPCEEEAGGPSDAETRQRADVETRGAADVETRGAADLETRGAADVHSRGAADVQSRGTADVQTRGAADVETRGNPNVEEAAGSGPPAARRRPDRGQGDRVDGWIRPQYTGRPDSPAGDYWTPVPESTYTGLDASDYGWPVPVDRLPAVPSYPPASGFDMEPLEEAEPTAVVPQWPPAKPSSRIELPRAWSATTGPVNLRPLDAVSVRRWAEADDDGRDGWRRNHGPADGDHWPADNGQDGDRWDDRWDDADGPAGEEGNGGAGPGADADQGQAADPATAPGERAGRAMWPADEPDQRPRRRSLMIRRGNRPDADPPSRGRQAREARRRLTSATEHLPAVADSTQMLPQVDQAPERDGEPRRRPRPRPGPQADARSTVYVSRHAAEPS